MIENVRQNKRCDVKIKADLRVSASGRFHVWVVDLSKTGFHIQSLSYVDKNRSIFLTLPGMAALEAKVAWKIGDDYGCQFIQPLHDAVFDHIVALYPALA